MFAFGAPLDLIGINPYVLVPEAILLELFFQAGKHKGPIPVCGTISGKPFLQTLVRYSGAWRLYVNEKMLLKSPKRIGEIVHLTLSYDPSDRSILPHPELVAALDENPSAKLGFNQLTPSRKKEIIRYIAALKSEESIRRNVKRAIRFLLGQERFIGRDTPL
ncbi:MAG: YdeI/OmpD-associated family protein [Bacteroidetes Order II. Incertae sedis bacterium]|nr:YdeI/OmpD-associated family protein [Bacteroidetes Order II. bacterium]